VEGGRGGGRMGGEREWGEGGGGKGVAAGRRKNEREGRKSVSWVEGKEGRGEKEVGS